jgi:hypothetical protein
MISGVWLQLYSLDYELFNPHPPPDFENLSNRAQLSLSLVSVPCKSAVLYPKPLINNSVFRTALHGLQAGPSVQTPAVRARAGHLDDFVLEQDRDRDR